MSGGKGRVGVVVEKGEGKLGAGGRDVCDRGGIPPGILGPITSVMDGRDCRCDCEGGSWSSDDLRVSAGESMPGIEAELLGADEV